MGSATFALPSLNALFEKGYEITGVITQPDKPAGRGQQVQAPPVKKRAFELHLPIYQPRSVKNDEARALMENLAADMIIVVAYGKILPKWLLEMPHLGCINVHGSILPKYRGAAPVHWAVANGEQATGVCTMQLDEGLDTGPVYLCERMDIRPDETVTELYDRMADLGAKVLIETVQRVENGTLTPVPQNHAEATLAPMLKKENGYIDWRMSAEQIHNRVRAFNPWPGTVAKFRGRVCKIVRSAVAADRPPLQPGLIQASRNALTVVCGNGTLLEILSIQPEGRKSVSGMDFANGARMQLGEKFESVMDN
jgi:methionyl-tRNA formyltransferase